jgi:hypothetical protein
MTREICTLVAFRPLMTTTVQISRRSATAVAGLG